MLDFSNLNYVAIVAATLVNMFVGAFWYSPVGFGKLWSKLSGVNMMDIPKKEATKALSITAISALLQSVLLAVLIHSLHVTTVLHGIEVGLVLWAGFTAATTISDALYARRGWKFWWLNSSFYLVVLVINSSILALWR
jgi:hypothetical protein